MPVTEFYEPTPKDIGFVDFSLKNREEQEF